MRELIFLLIGSGLLAFSSKSWVGLPELQVPEQKLFRVAEKLLQTDNFEIVELNESVLQCDDNPYSKQVHLKADEVVLANVFIRRVFTCDPVACKTGVQKSSRREDLEYFDYFAIVDKDTTVQNITVFDYQGTHGHEVAKRSWLSQFYGYDGDQFLIYGRDIDAISGATVSAEGMTYEIDSIMKCLNK